jgi:hypothetical protein
MSNSSSSGGTFLWLVNQVSGHFRNKRINKLNRQARGVEEYQSIAADALFPPNTYKDSVIVSGGSEDERLRVCEALLRNAYNAGHPVIVLHTGNTAMESIVAGNGFGMAVNAGNKKFDAFTSFEFNEIYQAVTDTCKSKYDIKPAGRYVLQAVYDLLASRGEKPYFSSFANCPYFKLGDQIATRLNSGEITQDAADKLNSLLFTGQAELPKIDAFFSDMKSQIDYLSAPDPKSVNAAGVLSAIKKKQILCIDARSSANAMLMELIVNSLVIAMNRGCDFSLMVDEISLVNNETLKNALCQKSSRRNIIVSKDLYALTGGKEDVFAAVIGEAEKTALFAHGSGVSCEKWSKYIGEYEKIDVSQSYNSGWSQSGRSFNSGGGQSERLKREAKIKPEEINRLLPNEAFFYDHASGSLLRAVIT